MIVSDNLMMGTANLKLRDLVSHLEAYTKLLRQRSRACISRPIRDLEFSRKVIASQQTKTPSLRFLRIQGFTEKRIFFLTKLDFKTPRLSALIET